MKTGETIPFNGSIWNRVNSSCTTLTVEEYWEITGVGGWKATWTRRGNTNIYDGIWTGPQGQKSTTVIEITITGNNMTGKRTSSSDGVLCTYNGQVSSDGKSLNGTASCTTGPAWNWSAVVRNRN